MTIKLLAKRLTDIVVSGLGMIILSPVFLVAAIAIRIESPGGSIFSQ